MPPPYTAVSVEPIEAIPYDGNITNQSLVRTGELEWVTLLDGMMSEGEEDGDELKTEDKKTNLNN